MGNNNVLFTEKYNNSYFNFEQNKFTNIRNRKYF